MPGYWIIAPVESDPPDFFNKVWQFDLENNTISIGWGEGGRGEAVSAAGEMRREVIPTIFRVEFLKFGMVAANNHQAG